MGLHDKINQGHEGDHNIQQRTARLMCRVLVFVFLSPPPPPAKHRKVLGILGRNFKRKGLCMYIPYHKARLLLKV